MPEGDTVFRTAERLRPALVGKTLSRSDFRVPRFATVDLVGDLITDVGTYGKHLFIRTDKLSIHTHLKMEGEWRVFHCGQRWTKPRVNARIVLANDEVEAVGFDLGKVEVLPLADEQKVIAHLGPDLLAPNFDADEAQRRLLAYPKRSIGAALLDQRNLAGIGNIYRSEICFLRKVHPATLVGDIDALPALVAEAHRVMNQAARQPPWRQLVYRKNRRPCPRCGMALVARVLDDPDSPDPVSQRERGIYFCPRCQPEPS
ncbi:Fpg/Nei family DNA glycosylase [Nocardia camponoti]|uniref:DNA-(apurinic or apyrimidinic site) lyase n=1 Tax=Nocardia camponoti TaxID=1616106 RepID=A0A917VAB3_9NOCA|nr:Fpg/Nei family DNA glycosylase [Nocardia camponoti]GGK56398.1 putative endonuclease 8 2 [Nocardia camponoti]